MRLTLSALASALTLVAGAAAAQDLPQGLVRLRDVDASIAQDMRYATADNFTSTVDNRLHASLHAPGAGPAVARRNSRWPDMAKYALFALYSCV